MVLKRFTPFQIIITALVALSIALSVGTIVALLRVQAAARIMLSSAAAQLAEVADSHIQYTVHLSQTLPISTSIAVNEKVRVPVSLVVSSTIPVNTQFPVREKILVPVNLQIDRVFPVDTTVPFKDTIVVPIDKVISIDETFGIPVQVPMYGESTIQVPIRANIPVKLDIEVPVDKQIPVKTTIPVSFPISETLPVDINLTIPVKMDIPVRMPVETEVTVPLSQTIPINVQVPIAMDVPIDIAIGDTPLGEHLRNLGDELRKIAGKD
jgi:hypothetical protein